MGIQELVRLNASTEGDQYKEANDTIPEIAEGNPARNVENDGIPLVEGPRVRFIDEADAEISFNVTNGRSSLNPSDTSMTSVRQGKYFQKNRTLIEV